MGESEVLQKGVISKGYNKMSPQKSRGELGLEGIKSRREKTWRRKRGGCGEMRDCASG